MFALRFGLLLFTWCAFSGLFDAYHLTLGVLSSAWVAGVSTHITLSQPSGNREGRGANLVLGLGLYIFWLLGEVLKANIQVLKLSLAPRVAEKITPTVVHFRTRLADDFSRFLLAHSITLTPGTVTVRVDGDRFIVHALTEEMAAGVPGDMEERLVKLFGGVEDMSEKPVETEDAAGDD